MAAKRKKAPKKISVDFSDEESVKLAMARELEEDADSLEIEEDKMLSGFGAGTFYRVSAGRLEYIVAENHDAAEELALAVVEQDIDENPEIFNKDFIARHIDTDRLRRDLMSDVQNMRHEDLQEEARRRPIKFMEDNNIDIPSPSVEAMRKHAEDMSDDENPAEKLYKELSDMSPEDQWSEIGEEPEVSDRDIEEVAEQEAEAALKDPMEYLEDIYGKTDAVEQAIKIAGIDAKAAAKDAVDSDGAEFYIAREDNTIHDGPDNIVYWRH